MIKYYDTVTESLSDGKSSTSIASTDSRVRSWFEPLPQGHRRVYDENGFPSTEEIPPHIPTPEEMARAIDSAIQTHLDDTAKTLRYDNMTSARAYAGYINAFQTEATKLAQWASECWVYAGTVEVQVASGARSMPTPEEAILELPKYQG